MSNYIEIQSEVKGKGDDKERVVTGLTLVQNANTLKEELTTLDIGFAFGPEGSVLRQFLMTLGSPDMGLIKSRAKNQEDED